MGGEKQGLMVVEMPNAITKIWLVGGNAIEQLQAKFKELEDGFQAWLDKQTLPVEAAAVTATGAAQGAAQGAAIGVLVNALTRPRFQAFYGGPLIEARNFAVFNGVNSGITCVMKRLRGEEDVESSMVAAFGSGVMFSVVSGMGGPNPAANAVKYGLFFALFRAGLFKLGQKFSAPPPEDPRYVKIKSMLSNLGLQKFERNFKKGLLTDSTLPLLTDSALKDVQIPPGARLLIIDHLQRCLSYSIGK